MTSPSGADTNPVRLTFSPYDDTVPKWHPTSGKIAFHHLNASSVMELGSVNSDGSNENLMVSGLVQPPYGYTTLISWLGASNTLLCVETNNFHELLAFNSSMAPFIRTVVDGNDAAFTRKLFVPGGRYSNCFVASRDGNTVAWRDQPNAGGTNTLTIRSSPYIPLSGQDTDAFGTVVLTATDPAIGTRGMALSPDGSKLVISMPSGAGFDLWSYSTTGTGTPVQLTTDGSSGYLNLNPDVSPDGTRILFQRSTGASGSSDLWLMNTDGSGKTNLTQTNGVDESAPSWGPDGTQYAFARIDGAESNIYKASLPVSSVVTINFDNMTEGPKAPDFLAAYGVSSVTYSGSAGAGPPLVSAQTGGNTIIPSAPNLLIQNSGSNDLNQSQTLRFDFSPRLSSFSLTRAGKFGFGSTDTWHAYFYNAAGTLLGSFGESTPLVNAVPLVFGFSAPSGQTIARMDLVSIWTGFATNRNIPVDDFVLTQAPPSNNANLASLVPSVGSLTPAFSQDTTAYSTSVGYPVPSISFTPTVADSSATVRINNIVVPSGSPSAAIPLNYGPNLINTVVTAQDGFTTKTYTSTVNRAAPSTNSALNNLVPSAGTLSPSFSSSTFFYSTTVSNSVTSVTFTPTLTDLNATVTINGVPVASGNPSGPITLNVGQNYLTAIVTAQDGVTNSAYTITVTRAAPSSNPALSNLVPSLGTLSPVFASGTLSYTDAVNYSVTGITLTPTVADIGATVKINNVTVASGSASGTISLNVGNNVITTLVTAQDGVTTRTYTVTVTRAAPSSNAALSNLVPGAGSLSPAFSSGTSSYSETVSYAVANITLTPTAADSGASVKVNNVTVASGSASGAIPLNVGGNIITTVVTAQDGTTTGTYTVNVTRSAPSNNANLGNLAISPGSFSPAFSSATNSYSASFAYATSSIILTPTVADGTATVKINNLAVASGSPSGAIALSVGDNTINIVVTAQDGVTTKTYTLVVNRGLPSNNANLAGLAISAGTLTPAFDNNIFSYTAGVVYGVHNLTVTPTVVDTTADVRVNGAVVSSGSASGSINLNVGENTITTVVTAQDGVTTRTFTIVVTRDPLVYVWNSTNGSWSDDTKWTSLQAPPIGGNPPLGNSTEPIILQFKNNPVPVNPGTPTTYNAINNNGSVSGIHTGFFGITRLILDGGPTGASGGGTNIIGSPTPGFGDPSLFFADGGGIVNSTSDGIGYIVQNYIVASNHLKLSGNGTSIVKLSGSLMPNTYIQPWTFPAPLVVTKEGTSNFELPSAQTFYTSYELREGSLQTPPGTLNCGPITLGSATSTSATLRIGTNSFQGGGLSDSVDITIVAGPPGSTRTIQSLATSINESVNLAGDLIIPTGSAVRINTGSSPDALMSLGSNGSLLSGGGDLIVTGSGKLFINSFVNNSSFTGHIIVESGTYQVPPAIPGGAFLPPPTTLVGGASISFNANNGNYSQNISIPPSVTGTPASSFNIVDNGTLDGQLTLNGGLDMSVAAAKNFSFLGNLNSSDPAAAIQKLGPGTLDLGPLPNNLPPDGFTAPASVLEGTLKVNRSLPGSDFSVSGGAVLGGSGTIGNLGVQPGAIIAPGNSPGTLGVHSATLAGGTLAVEIDGPLADKLTASSTLDLTGSTLTVTLLSGGFTQSSYVIAQGNPLTGTFAGVPAGYSVTYTSSQAILSQTGGVNGYDTWMNAYSNPSLSASDKLPASDPDHDGVSNLMEFILGGNPVSASPAILPATTISGPNLVLTFKRVVASETVANLSVEISNDLRDWTSVPPVPIGATSSGQVTVSTNGAADDITVTIPLNGNPAKFCRLKAISSGP